MIEDEQEKAYEQFSNDFSIESTSRERMEQIIALYVTPILKTNRNDEIMEKIFNLTTEEAFIIGFVTATMRKQAVYQALKDDLRKWHDVSVFLEQADDYLTEKYPSLLDDDQVYKDTLLRAKDEAQGRFEDNL